MVSLGPLKVELDQLAEELKTLQFIVASYGVHYLSSWQYLLRFSKIDP